MEISTKKKSKRQISKKLSNKDFKGVGEKDSQQISENSYILMHQFQLEIFKKKKKKFYK